MSGSGWPETEDMLLEENVWTLIDEMSAKATLCSVSSKLPLSQFMLESYHHMMNWRFIFAKPIEL